jgi:hypothetical protein
MKLSRDGREDVISNCEALEIEKDGRGAGV